MAKALYGHMAAVDPRLFDEISRLRARVHELEEQVAHLEARVEISDIDLTETFAGAAVTT